MRILKDLECTEIVQGRPACEIRGHGRRRCHRGTEALSGTITVKHDAPYPHPRVFFAKSLESTDCKGLLKSCDAKECVNC